MKLSESSYVFINLKELEDYKKDCDFLIIRLNFANQSLVCAVGVVPFHNFGLFLKNNENSGLVYEILEVTKGHEES